MSAARAAQINEYDSAKRDARIVELRSQRVPFREIAAELGVSHVRVQQLWKRILQEIPAAHLDEYRQEAAELADDATRRLLEICDDPTASHSTKIRALEVMVKWSERLARLRGEDAPVRRELEITDTTGMEYQLRATIAEGERELRAARALTVDYTVEADDAG